MTFTHFFTTRIKTLVFFVLLWSSQLILAGEPIGNINIMTQNLYVGANLFKVLDDTQPVPVIAAEIVGDIIGTNFSERADVFADQIAAEMPHLIGLQEVSLIRTQCPSDILTGTMEPNATDVFADYLQILMDALALRGLNYEVIARIENADVELPASNTPQLLPGCTDAFFDARLTDFDITLKRSDVPASVVLEQRYLANFPVPTPAGTLVFNRGFTIVDALVNGVDYRFVNTHLEVSGNEFADAFQFAQTLELTQTLDALAISPFGDKIVIVVGDFNSDPAQGPLVDCFAPPDFNVLVVDGCITPHFVMVDSGYTDLWSQLPASSGSGVTCCQSDLLDNPTSELDKRIDYIWVRLPAVSSLAITSVQVTVLGDDLADLTVNGLWSSDHAGVSAQVGFGIPAPRVIPTLNTWAILLLILTLFTAIFFQSIQIKSNWKFND